MVVLIGDRSYPHHGRCADADVEIGLVNNMPDAALEATERQFVALLEAAAPARTVRLRRFTLPGLARSPRAQRHLDASYCDIGELERSRLDALIVTGTEPRAAALPDEPYWPALTELIDWAERNTVSTIWSCLAAHAAVLHLDGIERHRLGEKCFGLFACTRLGRHPLTAGVAPRIAVPHSRWNELREDDLAACGYEVLTRSPQAGVDAFSRERNSLFVFFQGHPEYDAASLLGEYRRDLARFLQQESEICPALPHGYFDGATADALMRLRDRAIAHRRETVLSDFSRAAAADRLRNVWRPEAARIYGNWLALIAERKARRLAPAARLARRPAVPYPSSGTTSRSPLPAVLLDTPTAPFVERRRHDDPSCDFTGTRERRVAVR